MRSSDIECPSCHSPAGQKCVDVGIGDEQRNRAGFHFSRHRRAHQITTIERRERQTRDLARKKVGL